MKQVILLIFFPMILGIIAGCSSNLVKNNKTNIQSNQTPVIKEHPTTHHIHKKDTIVLEGKHHNHNHRTTTNSNQISASSNPDHVHDMFNQSYNSLIKGVVYKKGSNEILNNTKIVLETGRQRIDSSITAIGGMYTLRVQNPGSQHQIYVYRKGYKPLLIDIPDSLLDRKACVVKIQLEPDGSNTEEEKIQITLKGSVVRASTGQPVPGASIILRNNIDKTTQYLFCDDKGRYSVDLKKYSHYTISAAKDNCESTKINKSTIPIKVSTLMEIDLPINCPE